MASGRSIHVATDMNFASITTTGIARSSALRRIEGVAVEFGRDGADRWRELSIVEVDSREMLHDRSLTVYDRVFEGNF